MNASDYFAVGYEGGVYCTDCLPNGVDVQSDNVVPIFASSEWDSYPVCCMCGQGHDYVCLIEPDTEIMNEYGLLEDSL